MANEVAGRGGATGVCTYMGRVANGGKPFRFLRNKSQATAHGVYLLLYPPGPLKAALEREPGLGRAPAAAVSGRATNGRKPFRFVRNKSQATAHNVYLLLYPNGPLKAALEREPGLYQKVFEGLRAMDTGAIKGVGGCMVGGV